MTRCILYFVLLVLSGANASGDTREFYEKQTQEELDEALRLLANTNTARNVIFFIGDGLGLQTTTAARIYKGQLEKMDRNDVKAKLFYETFPYVALQKTYNNDRQVTSSASSATALMSGVKTNYGILGMDSSIDRKDCLKQQEGKADIASILKQSKDIGKSVGIITTARVTHATPAAAYAHSADRNWESTKDVVQGCKDIAAQLIDNGDIDVILGGGRRAFYLKNQTDPQTGEISPHHRSDGRDLIQEWKDQKKSKGKSYSYVWNKTDFDAIDPKTTDYVFGLFNPSHMKYDIDRNNSEPSLDDMTRKAIQILRRNNKGFFLMVEAARIDHAHHDNYAKRALHDVLAMDKAVKSAASLTRDSDTLIVVTGDHSHAFSIAGYPTRGNDIFGLVDIVPEDEAPYDKLGYTTLVYANGPANNTRINFTNVDTTDVDYQQTVAVRMPWETHGGEDIAVYATGPMSHLFHGVHENTYVYKVMAYASCVGANTTHCTRPLYPPCGPLGSAGTTGESAVVVVVSVLCVLVLVLCR